MTPPTPRRATSTGSTCPGQLLAQGWDAFWLDSAEPEECWPRMGDSVNSRQITIGNGAEFRDLFPLAHTPRCAGSLEGAEPGQARLSAHALRISRPATRGATVWSGDVYGTYWDLTRQVHRLTSHCLELPWTTDIGTSLASAATNQGMPRFQELYARWFEYTRGGHLSHARAPTSITSYGHFKEQESSPPL